MKLPRWADWTIFAAGIAISAAPAYFAARRCNGLDASAYIGAAYAIEKGRPIYTEEGFTLKGKTASGESVDVYFPPFLYHPAIASLYELMHRASGRSSAAMIRVGNIAGYAALTAGLAALLLAIGWPPWRIGAAIALYWLLPMAKFPLTLGNIGPVMAGLALLGAAALARGKPIASGVAFGLAALFKPTIWLIAAALALVWRAESRREKAALFAAWLGVYMAATLALVGGPGLGSMIDYTAMLARMGGRVWSMAYYDASLGATLLRAISAWSPDNHNMVVFGVMPIAASVGKWRHESLALMQAANLAGLLAMAAAVAWRRRGLAREPLALAGIASVAGFLCQPANWPHNYGMIAIAPAAIFLAARGAPRPIHRLAWESAILFILIMIPVMHAIIVGGFWTPGPFSQEPAAGDLARWHIARILDSLPTLWLLGIVALTLGAAKESRSRPADSGE